MSHEYMTKVVNSVFLDLARYFNNETLLEVYPSISIRGKPSGIIGTFLFPHLFFLKV